MIGNGAAQINWTQFKNLQVPDYEYYKNNRPVEFTTYMKWVEENMENKDKFLAGIDEQFQKLIGDVDKLLV